MKRGFISDNCAGAHPDVLKAIQEANDGHAPSYGDDASCARAQAAFRRLFEKDVDVSFVFNGTGANVLSLASMLRPYESVLCADCAHIFADETGAPERVLSVKLQGLPHRAGKIGIRDIEPCLSVRGNPHHCQPRVISLTNVTEFGAVYTPDEVREITTFAHAQGLLVHMDGARIANAVIAAGCSMAEMTWKAGLDVLSFGGVKNGTLFGEAVVYFNGALATDSAFMRKNITQLQSKMRFIGAQFEALLANELWYKNALHANRMALQLRDMLKSHPLVQFHCAVDANMLFLTMPTAIAKAVCADGFGSDMGGIIRMVTAWDTEIIEINALNELLTRITA